MTNSLINITCPDLVHVVFGFSAYGQLKSFLPSKANIVILRDDLTYGPINNLDTKQGRADRQSWLKHFYLDKPRYYLGAEIAKNITDWPLISSLKHDIGNQFCVWLGHNPRDELGFLRLLASLDEKAHVDLIHFPPSPLGDASKPYMGYSLGFYTPKDIPPLLKYRKNLTIGSRRSLIRLWNNISSNSMTIRIRREVFDYTPSNNHTHCDNQIVSECKPSYTSVFAVIGNLRPLIHKTYSDDYILWRISALVKDHILQLKGHLTELKSAQVKLNKNSF